MTLAVLLPQAVEKAGSMNNPKLIALPEFTSVSG